jgi:hypothetical protein
MSEENPDDNVVVTLQPQAEGETPPPAEPKAEEEEKKSSDPLAIIDELIVLLHEHMPSHAEADAVAEDVNKRLGRETKEEPEPEEPKWSTPEAQKAFDEGLKNPQTERIAEPSATGGT